MQLLADLTIKPTWFWGFFSIYLPFLGVLAKPQPQPACPGTQHVHSLTKPPGQADALTPITKPSCFLIVILRKHDLVSSPSSSSSW